MIHSEHTALHVAIVDRRGTDYSHLAPLVDRGLVSLAFCSTGRSALQHAAERAFGLWMIHIELPDMSGVDLLDMLHDLGGPVTAFLVTDCYRPEDEQLCLRHGAAQFVCKPLDPSWLLHIRPRTEERRTSRTSLYRGTPRPP